MNLLGDRNRVMEYNRDVGRRKHIVKLPVYFQNHLPLLRDNGLEGGRG
jgi:hypothetical protein